MLRPLNPQCCRLRNPRRGPHRPSSLLSDENGAEMDPGTRRVVSVMVSPALLTLWHTTNNSNGSHTHGPDNRMAWHDSDVGPKTCSLKEVISSEWLDIYRLMEKHNLNRLWRSKSIIWKGESSNDAYTYPYNNKHAHATFVNTFERLNSLAFSYVQLIYITYVAGHGVVQ